LFITGGIVVISSVDFGVLMIGRALQGLGAAGIFPVASAVIGDTIEPARRGRALGILGSVYGLAFMLGPILGGVLVQFGWRWPFIANLCLATIVLIVSRKRVPDFRSERESSIDWLGIGVLAVLLGSLSIGMNQIDTASLAESLSSISVWPLLLLSILLLPVFKRIEDHADDPVLRPGLIRRRQVLLVCLFATAAGLVEAAFVFMTDFTRNALEVSDRVASFMLLPLVGAVSVASPLAGRLLDRIGSKAIIAGGLLLIAGGMSVLGWVAPSAGAFYTGSVAIGIGLACLLGSALSYILLAEADVAERTVAQGVNTIFISIGQLLGSAAIGAIAASALSPAEGYQQAFAWIGVTAAALFLVSLLLNDRKKEREGLT
ncbi:MAG TPA: MFS transporter, partial [Rhodothermales bacterium]|nr:MFS transporter [Rhodothermales bacterium]